MSQVFATCHWKQDEKYLCSSQKSGVKLILLICREETLSEFYSTALFSSLTREYLQFYQTPSVRLTCFCLWTQHVSQDRSDTLRPVVLWQTFFIVVMLYSAVFKLDWYILLKMNKITNTLARLYLNQNACIIISIRNVFYLYVTFVR